jgi:tripartite-type tricarboxylate transporter receptor subunit TctC
MHTLSRREFTAAVAGGFAIEACAAVGAFAYPSRPVNIIVPVPAGGTADLLIRPLAQAVSEALGQPLVIHYKPGASAVIASQFVAKSEPDGHTILLGYTSHAINPAASRSVLPYDTERDFAPVSLLGKVPLVLVVGSDVPARNLAELIALAKADPGGLTYGASGLGGAGHLGAELMAMMGGFQLRTVPYKGGAEAIVDLLAGRVTAMLDSYSVFEQHLGGGKLRMLAVSSAGRQQFAPAIPAVAETISGYEAVAWWGLLAPAATPKDAVQRLSSAFANAWRAPALRDRLTRLGWEPVGSTPEAFDAFIRMERRKWADVVKQIGFRSGS